MEGLALVELFGDVLCHHDAEAGASVLEEVLGAEFFGGDGGVVAGLGFLVGEDVVLEDDVGRCCVAVLGRDVAGVAFDGLLEEFGEVLRDYHVDFLLGLAECLGYLGAEFVGGDGVGGFGCGLEVVGLLFL